MLGNRLYNAINIIGLSVGIATIIALPIALAGILAISIAPANSRFPGDQSRTDESGEVITE